MFGKHLPILSFLTSPLLSLQLERRSYQTSQPASALPQAVTVPSAFRKCEKGEIKNRAEAEIGIGNHSCSGKRHGHPNSYYAIAHYLSSLECCKGTHAPANVSYLRQRLHRRTVAAIVGITCATPRQGPLIKVKRPEQLSEAAEINVHVHWSWFYA